MDIKEVTERIDELHKLWDIYPSSSLSLEINYYETLKKQLYEKR